MKKMLLVLVLLFAAIPALAQDVTPGVDAAELMQDAVITWRGLFVAAVVVGLSLLLVVVWLARQLAKAGDARAQALLDGIKQGVQWIPTDSAAKYVREFQTGAEKTATPVDDVIGSIAGAGVNVLRELQGKPAESAG